MSVTVVGPFADIILPLHWQPRGPLCRSFDDDPVQLFLHAVTAFQELEGDGVVYGQQDPPS